MIIIAGTLTLDPADRDAFLAAGVAAAAGTRTEPGNQEYVMSPDPVDPGVVRLFELWDDEESLAPHQGTEHMQAFGRAIKDLRFTGRDIQVYTVSGSRPL